MLISVPVKALVFNPPETVLVICLQRLGDVLLTTPLALSIRSAYPRARIDWLVFEGTEGLLQDNHAANEVITLNSSASIKEILRLARSIFQKYDLAISTQAGDRPSFLARIAGRRAVTFASAARGGKVRNWIFSAAVSQSRMHRIEQILTLLGPLRIEAKVVLSAPRADFSFVQRFQLSHYVVLHPGAAFEYKKWTTLGWRDLANRFIKAGFTVVVTGGANTEEKNYLDDIFAATKVVRADGVLTWPQMSGLLERARYFVGVDTSVTHLAVACNLPGLAILGPTDPTLWGPYKSGGYGSISVEQKSLACVPCQREGCERHIRSRSLCLDLLDVDAVWSRVVIPPMNANRISR